jgi:hypothetical protein
MRTVSELTIRGASADLERLLAGVEARLRDGWKRNRQAEERLGRHGVRGPWDYCFSCTATPERPAAGLWVHARSPSELYASTVVPLEKQKLTEEESARLLVEFEREFLGPAAAEVGVKTEVVRHRLTLEHDLSPEAARRLRDFSSAANRAAPDAADRGRWNAFLVRVHRDESRFDPTLLDEWLGEAGWPEDTRSQLVGEYEKARSLLSAYDAETERH